MTLRDLKKQSVHKLKLAGGLSSCMTRNLCALSKPWLWPCLSIKCLFQPVLFRMVDSVTICFFGLKSSCLNINYLWTEAYICNGFLRLKIKELTLRKLIKHNMSLLS